MSTDLEGKTVIITGACGVIGRSFASALGAAGMNVVAVALTNSEQLAAELSETGVRAIGVDADVASVAATEAGAAATLAEFGRIDVLVNNAAFFRAVTRSSFEDIDPDEWDTCMAVNVRGPWLCARAVAPAMRRQRSGAIINISSNTVWKGVPTFLHYVTSKSASLGFTRSLARELGDYGITVNAVAPDFIPDDSLHKHQPGHDDFVVSQRAIKRTSVPDDMVGVVLFLASSQAEFITGQSFLVNGGAHMQ